MVSKKLNYMENFYYMRFPWIFRFFQSLLSNQMFLCKCFYLIFEIFLFIFWETWTVLSEANISMGLILFTAWEHFTTAANPVSTPLEYIHVLWYYLLSNMMAAKKSCEMRLRSWDCSLLKLEIGLLHPLLCVLALFWSPYFPVWRFPSFTVSGLFLTLQLLEARD